MGIKSNLKIISKNHAADSEKAFLTNSISKPFGRATASPTAWELKFSCTFTEIYNKDYGLSEINKHFQMKHENFFSKTDENGAKLDLAGWSVISRRAVLGVSGT